jgi:hypothetical protein
MSTENCLGLFTRNYNFFNYDLNLILNIRLFISHILTIFMGLFSDITFIDIRLFTDTDKCEVDIRILVE